MLIDSTVKYAMEFVKDKRALDIGCIGAVWEEGSFRQFCARHRKLLETAGELYGIDVNQEGILRAREEGLTNIYFCDVCHVFHAQYFIMHHANEEKFDVVTCMDCIEHLMNVGNFLENTKMFLKPGGKVFIATANMFFVRYWLRKLKGNMTVSHEHAAWYCEKTLRQVCEFAGYKVEQSFFANDGKPLDEEVEQLGGVQFEEWMAKRICVVATVPEARPKWSISDMRPKQVKI